MNGRYVRRDMASKRPGKVVQLENRARKMEWGRGAEKIMHGLQGKGQDEDHL